MMEFIHVQVMENNVFNNGGIGTIVNAKLW